MSVVWHLYGGVCVHVCMWTSSRSVTVSCRRSRLIAVQLHSLTWLLPDLSHSHMLFTAAAFVVWCGVQGAWRRQLFDERQPPAAARPLLENPSGSGV